MTALIWISIIYFAVGVGWLWFELSRLVIENWIEPLSKRSHIRRYEHRTGEKWDPEWDQFWDKH